MILHTAQVIKNHLPVAHEQNLLNAMRGNIAATASRKGMVLVGIEQVERIHIRQRKNDGHWVSAKPANATHIKITIEQEAVYE